MKSDGSVDPDWSIGLGWFVYFHHITPTDQRWFLTVGTVVVAGAIDVASGGTLGVVATVMAGVLVATIDDYYHPTGCLEIQLTYAGLLHNVYRTSC